VVTHVARIFIATLALYSSYRYLVQAAMRRRPSLSFALWSSGAVAYGSPCVSFAYGLQRVFLLGHLRSTSRSSSHLALR